MLASAAELAMELAAAVEEEEEEEEELAASAAAAASSGYKAVFSIASADAR